MLSLHHQPDSAGLPDPDRGGGLGVFADALGPRRHLPGAPRLGRHQLHPAGARQLPRRDRIDRPWILQFLDFLWGLARLDFGKSMWSGKPVIMEIATRFPISLEVAVMATIIAVVDRDPLGTISALKQNTWIDLVVRTFSIAGLATRPSGSASCRS